MLILHNETLPAAGPADADVLVQAQAVLEAAAALGRSAELVPVTLNLEALRARLRRDRPNVVFNLAESLGGSDRLAYLVSGLLDVERVPYTGNSTEALFVSNHKVWAKRELARAGLPTPPWLAVNSNCGSQPVGDALPSGTRFIIKPIFEHASYGMDERAVVTVDDADALRLQLGNHAARLHTDCFAEQYIDGREFNLSLLASAAGPEVLPPAEIDFSAFPQGKPRIVDYRAKWDESAFEYHHTPRRFDFSADDNGLLTELGQLAVAAWNALGLAGYVRVDFRVDGQGRPWILEVNTNPCISPDAGFAAAVARAGIRYEQAIERIIEAAIRPIQA